MQNFSPIPSTFDGEDGHEYHRVNGKVTHYAKCDHPLHEPSTFGYSAEADANFNLTNAEARP